MTGEPDPPTDATQEPTSADTPSPSPSPAAGPRLPRVAVVVATLLALAGAGIAATLALDAGGVGDGTAAPDTTTTTAPPAPADAMDDDGGAGWTLEPYAGVGVWIDVFDWAPSYARPGDAPVLDPADLGVLAALGVDTLFLQAAARDDPGVVDEAVLAEVLASADAAGLHVVGWYVPRFSDVDADLARLLAIRDFESAGHRFDGLGVDIEFTADVEDDAARSRALVGLSERLDMALDGAPVSAIVLEPVLLEEVNERFWPGFPWAEIAPHYDVWQPMTYWTNRTVASGLRDPSTYVLENILRLRANTGDPDLVIHPIGGVGDEADEGELAAFAEVVAGLDVIGASIYDLRSMTVGELTSSTRLLRAALGPLAAPGGPPAPATAGRRRIPVRSAPVRHPGTGGRRSRPVYQ